jgi:hypothetical protein
LRWRKTKRNLKIPFGVPDPVALPKGLIALKALRLDQQAFNDIVNSAMGLASRKDR